MGANSANFRRGVMSEIFVMPARIATPLSPAKSEQEFVVDGTKPRAVGVLVVHYSRGRVTK